MIDFRRLAFTICAAVGLASAAAAQAPAPAPTASAPAAGLAAVRGRVPTDADRRVIAQWIAGQIQTAAKEPQDLAAFRRAFAAESKANGATEQFRQALADLSAEAFAKALADPANAQGPGALMCGVMLSMLADMDRPSAVPAALDGLRHKSELVRERAATCLTRVRRSVPAADTQRVFDAVVAAAGKETNGIPLRALYRAAVAYGKPEDAIKAVLTVLDTRIAAYQKRDLRGCAGDMAAADLLADQMANRRAQLTPETQQRVVQRLADLLTVAVLNYKDLISADAETKESRAAQQNLELLVDASERALVAASKVDPQKQSVTEQMRGPESGRAERMQAALDRWIGTAQKAGALNQTFNVPAGLPKIKLAPPPTTRPAE